MSAAVIVKTSQAKISFLRIKFILPIDEVLVLKNKNRSKKMHAK